jgi:hypothetical protein
MAVLDWLGVRDSWIAVLKGAAMMQIECAPPTLPHWLGEIGA